MKRRIELSEYGSACCRARRPGIRRFGVRRFGLAMLAAAHLVYMASAAPAAAMQILEAADHAELTAQISATGVNRIALGGDRIARVIRSPGGYAVEHDPATGDLYLRPLVAQMPPAADIGPDAGADAAVHEPVTLFIGTEKGFTYRLALIPAARGSAQILIRNAAASAAPAVAEAGDPGDAYVAALVRLVRAVARREPLPGHAIEAFRSGTAASGPGAGVAGMPERIRIIETWRGPRFSAHVIEAHGALAGAADLAGTIPGLPGRAAAAWLAASGTGPGGGRLAVVVTERADPGRAGDAQ